jgi:hypothetical protein
MRKKETETGSTLTFASSGQPRCALSAAIAQSITSQICHSVTSHLSHSAIYLFYVHLPRVVSAANQYAAEDEDK